MDSVNHMTTTTANLQSLKSVNDVATDEQCKIILIWCCKYENLCGPKAVVARTCHITSNTSNNWTHSYKFKPEGMVPPHAPDLTTLDFHLWQYFKYRVYHTKPVTLEELLEEITVSCAANPEHKLDGICHSYACQIQHCPDVNKENFEHKSFFNMS
jgi:hypothetical protein